MDARKWYTLLAVVWLGSAAVMLLAALMGRSGPDARVDSTRVTFTVVFAILALVFWFLRRSQVRK